MGNTFRDPDLYDALISKYPKLYRHYSYIDCGIGWIKIIDDLSKKLESLINDLKEIEEEEEELPYASQIKEKFGELRFYMSSETQEMSKEIDKATRKSRKTCEICGKKGKIRKANNWLYCLCDECCEKRGIKNE